MSAVIKVLVDLLSVPAILVGLTAFAGYLAMKDKNFSDALAGGIKASIGFFILVAGAVTLIGSLDVLGPMIEEAFNVQGVIPNNEAIVAIAPHLEIPFTCMGGIKAHNVHELLERGARHVAVVTAVTAAADVRAAAAELDDAIQTGRRTSHCL